MACPKYAATLLLAKGFSNPGDVMITFVTVADAVRAVNELLDEEDVVSDCDVWDDVTDQKDAEGLSEGDSEEESEGLPENGAVLDPRLFEVFEELNELKENWDGADCVVMVDESNDDEEDVDVEIVEDEL